MKNFILIFAAIVVFGLSVNAQNMSFKSLTRTFQPKGELVAVVETNMGATSDHFYQEWSEYSLTQWEFRLDNGNKKVVSIKESKAFYDELEFERAQITKDDGVFNIWIPTKKEKDAVFIGYYNENRYTNSSLNNINLIAKTRKDADDLIAKLKDKAFDMGLDLDADVKRVNLKEEMVFNEQYPDGIASSELSKIEESNSSSNASESSSSSDSSDEPTVSFVSVTLKHTGGERYYLLINGVENEKCQNAVFSFTHSKYGEETRRYTFCEGQKLIEKGSGRVIFTASKSMDGTTFNIN